MNIWVHVSVSIRTRVRKCFDKLSVTADTFRHSSVNLLWKIIWVWQVIHVFYFRIYIKYQGWYQIIGVENYFQFLGNFASDSGLPLKLVEVGFQSFFFFFFSLSLSLSLYFFFIFFSPENQIEQKTASSATMVVTSLMTDI